MLRVPLSENKEVARDMLAKLVNDAAKARLGLGPYQATHLVPAELAGIEGLMELNMPLTSVFTFADP
jgi:hypothetical protein